MKRGIISPVAARTISSRLKEADLKYINREPREIDLITIRELEEELKRRKKKIQALIEETKHIKLELANREDNLNRMFNTRPNVGVLRPQDFAAKRSPRANSSERRPSSSKQRLPPLMASAPTLHITEAA